MSVRSIFSGGCSHVMGASMRAAAVVLALLCATSAQAACNFEADSLAYARDKRLHAQVSAEIAAVVTLADKALGLQMTPTQRFIAALAPGFARELRQGCKSAKYRVGEGFSRADLAWNALGAAAVAYAPTINGLTVMPHGRGVLVSWEF